MAISIRHGAPRQRWASTLLGACLLLSPFARAQSKVELNPSRPTIGNSTGIQSRGVVQVEVGYDAYPQAVPGEQQTVDTAFFYTPWERARLDFTWSAFSHVNSPEQQATGIGTIQLGTKILIAKENRKSWRPAIGFQYEAELPTASKEALQGYGQQAILLLNHHIGPVNLILNGSVVQTDCQKGGNCTVGGQQSAQISFRVNPHNTLYAEAVAQNIAQSNTPPGTYLFGGFVHRFSDLVGIDGGLRFGVSDHSASFGTTVGIFFGKRLRDDGGAKRSSR